jgi:hypothetical protein
MTDIPQFSEDDRRGGQALVLMSLAYISPGEERRKLIRWMEVQATKFEEHKLPPGVTGYFREFVETLRMGEGAEPIEGPH